jgi:hypothetical protein
LGYSLKRGVSVLEISDAASDGGIAVYRAKFIGDGEVTRRAATF